MARPTERRVDPDEHDTGHYDRGTREDDPACVETRAEKAETECRIGGEENEQAAAVGTEPVSRDRDEREGADGEPEPTEQSRTEQCGRRRNVSSRFETP